MRVLVACEFTGVVRDAFLKRGHDAWSCDLQPTEVPGPHVQGDALEAVNNQKWDLLIAHPPCTHLAVSGARWFPDKVVEQKQALDFFLAILNSPIRMICVENPISIISTHIRKPHQIIQPWMFGHEVTKTTCLWLKNLPHLKPTLIVDKGEFYEGKKRWNKLLYGPKTKNPRDRSRTFPGVAEAMAQQWSRQHRTGFGIYVPFGFNRSRK